MRPGLAGRLLRGAVLVLVVGVAAVLTYRHLPDITTSRLPGAAGGADTYPIAVEFRDVLDLVPNATVRLADVPVGRVTSIRVGQDDGSGHIAVVDLAIDADYQLPADTTAAIRSTSLLGEKYVELTVPDHGTGNLQRAGSIPLAATTADVEVEQLLSSVGALLNGGGLEKLSTITRELSAALGGHEDSARALLGDIDDIVTRINAGRDDVVAAIKGAQRLATAYAAQSEIVGKAITALDPATGVLARQQAMLTRALTSLERLDHTATPLIRASTVDTAADLEALGPVLKELATVADKLPRTLNTLLTFPFPDNSVPALSNAYAGTGGFLTLDLRQLLGQIVPTPDGQDPRNTPPDNDAEPGEGPPSNEEPPPLAELPEQLLGDLHDLLAGQGVLP